MSTMSLSASVFARGAMSAGNPGGGGWTGSGGTALRGTRQA